MAESICRIPSVSLERNLTVMLKIWSSRYRLKEIRQHVDAAMQHDDPRKEFIWCKRLGNIYSEFENAMKRLGDTESGKVRTR